MILKNVTTTLAIITQFSITYSFLYITHRQLKTISVEFK